MDNLGWGLQITVIGMGLVFLLLALLWGLLTLVLALDKTPEATPAPAPTMQPSTTQSELPADLVAAIATAVLKYRSAKRPHRNAPSNEEAAGSRWVATGRTRQNASWQPRGK